VLEAPRRETRSVLADWCPVLLFSDGLSTAGMFLSGLIMVTRNRYVSNTFHAILFNSGGLERVWLIHV